MSFRVKKAYLKKEAIKATGNIPGGPGLTGRSGGKGRGFFGSVGRHLSGQGPLGSMAPILGGMALQSMDSPIAQMGGGLLMMKGLSGGGASPTAGSRDRASMQKHRMRNPAAWQKREQTRYGGTPPVATAGASAGLLGTQ